MLSAPAQIILEVRSLWKSFSGVQALRGAQLAVASGTVHAVLGENGAGKSTLMKILAGLLRPDSGEILFAGQAVRLPNPHAALKLGIAMIHQELMPFPELSVAENILLGQEPPSAFPGWISHRRLNREAGGWLERLGMKVSPARRMGDLSVAEMQMIEIARALAHRTRVIIMDEPTSALSQREVGALFRVVRDLRAQGVAIIFITHKLDEVLAIADHVTVLRDGQHIATYALGEVDRTRLIRLMVGREWEGEFVKQSTPQNQIALEVRGLGRRGEFADISFSLRQGEVLGLAGLLGAGRTEVVRAIYGLTRPAVGEIWVRGRPAVIKNPADAIRHGIAYVGEDRQAEGLASMLPVKHNLTLANLRDYCWGGLINAERENRAADACFRDLAIKAESRDQRVESLSGGNQQKVVLGRALLTEPDILLLDEPTRGIDIGAKAEVYALIARLAAAGKAILLVSSELLEILALSDRLLVLREGRISAELNPREATQESILSHSMAGPGD